MLPPNFVESTSFKKLPLPVDGTYVVTLRNDGTAGAPFDWEIELFPPKGGRAWNFGVADDPRGIESRIREIQGVSGVAVLAPATADGRELIAYVTGAMDVEALRAELKSMLPDYMVPAQIVAMAAFPLNASGKIDRKALPPPTRKGGARDADGAVPQTETERVLASIWSEVLGRERVSVAASFFELGGHSLLVTQVVSRLRAAFGVEMPLRTMFEAPTVAALAERVETLLWVAQPPAVAVPAGAMGEEEEEGEL